MAPTPRDGPSLHLAPLDTCLTRGHRLISWRYAYDRICACHEARTVVPPAVVSFIADPQSIRQLRNSYEPYGPASKETRDDFDTRTSAVNITPVENGPYNIKEIQDDVLWFSKQAKIDEVSALRIAVLEWQSRPDARILSGYSEEERIGLQKALGREASFPSQAALAHFGSQAARRARLVELYLEERLYIIRCYATITSSSLLEAPPAPAERQYADLTPDPSPALEWVPETESKIRDGGRGDGAATAAGSANDLFTKAINGFQSRLKDLQEALPLSVEDGEQDERLAVVAQDFQLTELVSILQIMFVSTCASPEPFNGDTVQSWYAMMQNLGFMSTFNTPIPQQQAHVTNMQLLASLITVSILKVPYSTDRIALDQDPLGSAAYFFNNHSCVQTVTATLAEAGTNKVKIAAPALLSLGSVLQALRDQLNSFRGDMDDEDSPESPLSSRATVNSKNAQRTLETAMQHIPTFGQDIDPLHVLAGMALDDGDLFGVIAGLVDALPIAMGSLVDPLPQLHARVLLLEVLRCSLVVARYCERAVECTLAILNRQPACAASNDVDLSRSRKFIAEIFLGDSIIFESLLYKQARLRFPYETSPFLLLAESLMQSGPLIKSGADSVPFQDIMETATRFMQVMPAHFGSYELTREEEGANAIRLTEDLPLFADRRANDSRNLIANHPHDGLDDMAHQLDSVRAGTLGVVVSETKPPVVAWEFSYSLWRYLGAILSTIPLGSTRRELLSTADARAIAPDILSLMTRAMEGPAARLSAQVPKQDPKLTSSQDLRQESREAALRVMEEASDCLDRGQDIVSLVFEIFEEELTRHVEQRGEDSTDLLVSCVQFIKASLPHFPHRVWPALARTGLLNMEGEGGKLMAVVGSTEIVLGRYDFVLATVDLFRQLVQDVLSHCISYEAQSAALTRYADRFNVESSRPPFKITSAILLAFSRCYLDFFQSSAEWTFVDPEQQLQLTSSVADVFNTILTSVFGYDDSQDLLKKSTKALAAAAKYLSQAFLSTNASQPAINSLVLRFVTGAHALATSSVVLSHKTNDSVLKLVILSKSLLHIGRIGNVPSAYFEAQLFRTLASLVRVFMVRSSLRIPTLELITLLIKKSALSEQEPPSLFGHLGGDVSKNFIRVLYGLVLSSEDESLKIATWRFMEAIVSNKQQWCATFVLTGLDPRERLKTGKSGKKSQASEQNLFDTALEELTRGPALGSPCSLQILRFVSQAQNHWPWVSHSIRKHTSFVEKLGEHAGMVHEEKNLSYMSDQFQLTKMFGSVAVVAEILAMYLHNASQMGDGSFVKQLIPKVGFLQQKGMFQPKYADALHQKLRKNFEAVFSGSTPQCLKRQFGDGELGSNYYYDLDFAHNVLAFHPSWGRKAGFQEEFVRANINLSLVESQIQAISSWRILAVELSRYVGREESLQKPLAHLVVECLELCSSADVSHQIFAQVVSSCADLALTVLQRLVAAKVNTEATRSILKHAWSLVQRAGEMDTFVGEAAPYYRTSLKILLLAIQPHTWPAAKGSSASLVSKDGKLSQVSTILLDVIGGVVAKGFRTLAAELHENSENILPSDFAVITAILQATQRVQAADSLHSLISLRLSDSGCVRYAIALFSWSDRLTASGSGTADEEDRDPIFGELSLSFLLELSNLQPMAEFLASESILSQLNTANIMKFFRRTGGCGPFDTPSPRLFTIWSRGILPLCLNLLLTVGDSIAMEVAMFLNNYPEQLKRASGGFDDKPQPTPRDPTAGCISLNMAAEAQTLALLGAVLDRCRASPAAAVLGSIPEVAGWDRAMVKEDLETWLGGGRAALRERLLPTSERELAWLRQGAAAGGGASESRLEQMVVGEMEAALQCLSMS